MRSLTAANVLRCVWPILNVSQEILWFWKRKKQGTEKLSGRKIECEILYKFNTKEIEKFYKKKDIDKHGLAILAIRKKYNFQ